MCYNKEEILIFKINASGHLMKSFADVKDIKARTINLIRGEIMKKNRLKIKLVIKAFKEPVSRDNSSRVTDRVGRFDAATDLVSAIAK